jgi:histone deacetylase 1/2
MIVKLDKALYGCIEFARLWYYTFKDFLEADGFKVNSQDICVFNKGEGENQITIGVYVDDLFISSLNKKLIDDLVLKIIKQYGEECKFNYGQLHSYLSMIMDFNTIGKVKITMPQYVNDMMEQFQVEGRASTPALENLFNIREDSPLLDDMTQDIFHSRVAKVLYLAKRVRPELLPTVIFLSTRVKKATDDDWFKLTRMLKYINGTRDLGIVLEAGKVLSIRSYVDASFAVHPDMRSHSGASITLGKGPVFAKSSKQKLMSKSSTESELIGLSDNFPQVIWTRNFLIEQGYDVPPGIVYQDNQSTLTMVKKGRSTSERTRHINIRFFFIKDKVDNGELELEYLPTEDMVADILTKPLQGQLFRKLRNQLLNWTEA